jgi:hypothetical protein
MNFLQKAIATATLAGALALAGAASAATFTLNTTDVAAFGAGPYGTVTTSGGGTSLTLTLSLANGTTTDTGTHEALTFNLTGNVTGSSFSGAGPNLNLLTFAAYPGSYVNPGAPFTTNAAVSCPGCQGGGTTVGTPWTLTLTGTNLAVGTVFAADQFSQGATGAVWNAGGGVVPEPSTWALLIAGFGMVGFMLRRRHGLALATHA